MGGGTNRQVTMNEPELTVERKPRTKLPLLLVIVGGIIVIAVVVVVIILSSGKETPATGALTASHNVKAESSEGEEIVSISELVVNPKNTRGGRFFATSIGVVCRSKTQADEVKKREPILRDRLIMFFSLQTLEVLSDINRREQIKVYVKAIIDREITNGPVKEVLFSRYIVQ